MGPMGCPREPKRSREFAWPFAHCNGVQWVSQRCPSLAQMGPKGPLGLMPCIFAARVRWIGPSVSDALILNCCWFLMNFNDCLMNSIKKINNNSIRPSCIAYWFCAEWSLIVYSFCYWMYTYCWLFVWTSILFPRVFTHNVWL